MILKRKVEITTQTIGEEIANAITHGLGFILSIVGFVILLYNCLLKGSALHIVSCSLYGGSLLLLYLISTLYHSITHHVAKKVFRRLDHISIYLLIAGTCMPLTLVVLKGPLGWTLFGIECGLCLIGVLFKAIFGPKFSMISSSFYLIMGWVSIIAFKPMITALSLSGFAWVLLGGIFYSFGIIFFALDKKYKYSHAIWHIFVLSGSVCHFFLILLYIVPFSV